MPDKAPAYVSAPSADDILSTIRPTKIKPESLRSLNIFLDELLWLVLHSARCLATNRLKAGLLQIMPSALGKDAILEAEVELRAYKTRSPLPVLDEPGVKQADFPLQPTFELLRYKCEAYSTLGDQEENVTVEAALLEKMIHAGPGSPTPEQVAPAALYLTAILEHVCEHVLNNLGQVVARDSSRATAHSQDMYIALCEDTAVYPLFKTMKVHEHIEAQSRAFKPSHAGSSSISGGPRTRSVSRIRPSQDVLPVRKMSLPVTTNELPSSTSVPPSSFTRRPSADTALATGSRSMARSLSGATLPRSNKSSLERTRTSLERITGKRSVDGHTTGRTEKSGRGIKLFGKASGRTSVEDGRTSKEPGQLDARSMSSLSDGNRHTTVAFQQGSLIESDAADDSDGPFSQDFDELMRSGATMKVSLTPDRLKTFETFAKKKSQINTRSGFRDPTSFSAIPPPTSEDMALLPRAPSVRREHNPILEADETARPHTHNTAQPQLPSNDPRIMTAPPTPVPHESVGRARSHTESSSHAPPVGAKPGSSNGASVFRKTSFRAHREKLAPDSTPPSEPNTIPKVPEAPKLATLPATPARRKGRRPESMDLDDVIGEPTLSRRPTGLSPKPAHQTTNTRDLIDFLAQGPPEPYHPPRSASSSVFETGKASKQSGSRWFKRFVGGSSSNSERVPAVPDVPGTARMIGKQKSTTNIRSTSAGSGTGGAVNGRVPPSPALSLDTTLQALPSVTLARKISPNRKAVPAWNPDEPTPDAANEPQSPPAPPPATESTPPKQLRSEADVFPAQATLKPRTAELAPSPASSKPSSLRRVPVPKLYTETDAELEGSKISEAQLVRRRQDSRAENESHAEPKRAERPRPLAQPVALPTEEKDRPVRTASPLAPAIGITADQALELRGAFAHATTADECRVLLDLMLGQWGLGRPTPEPSVVPPLSAGCSEFDDGDEAMAVDMLLGEGSMRLERQWPLTPKDSLSKLQEASVASVGSS